MIAAFELWRRRAARRPQDPEAGLREAFQGGWAAREVEVAELRQTVRRLGGLTAQLASIHPDRKELEALIAELVDLRGG